MATASLERIMDRVSLVFDCAIVPAPKDLCGTLLVNAKRIETYLRDGTVTSESDGSDKVVVVELRAVP